MFRSWLHQDEEKIPFWLEFQVVHDGLDPPAAADNSEASFTCFGALPPELRLHIWECLIQPRIVAVVSMEPGTQDEKRVQIARRSRKRSTPVLLHVNREARTLALRHYQPAFSWKTPPRLATPESGVTPAHKDARVWFNFEIDALLLLGDLEPSDHHGFNSPMVYFFRKDDTCRVRHVACAFEEIHLSLYESDHIFGTLFHVIDRFPNAERLLVTTTPRDRETRNLVLPTTNNVLQKLWCAFINGTTSVNTILANKQIIMLKEDDLASFIVAHI
ncbi:hypothetical protein QBC42DRAFT_111437 [Cladorrhinum samala]|uniref:2EXR domain-containing protein n=1 Tax=Cladorrhinum samala TaxID=585594 RepID=A0AAV9HGE3_9PEZI|nr:hypothetical protein QBC42DRAFT_111437 [Cladorrhinum samala]